MDTGWVVERLRAVPVVAWPQAWHEVAWNRTHFQVMHAFKTNVALQWIRPRATTTTLVTTRAAVTTIIGQCHWLHHVVHHCLREQQVCYVSSARHVRSRYCITCSNRSCISSLCRS